MLNVPKKLKIGGNTYAVLKVDAEELGSHTAAQIDFFKQTIKIAKATENAMQVSLLHEIFHGINMEFEEERVEFLAQAFHALIVDNPQLFGGDSNERR